MTTTGDRDALAALMDAAGPGVEAGLARTEERLEEIATGQGAALAEQAGATVGAGGKRLRPLLVFLCGGENAELLVPAAVAVELLHTATLVHDDVLDAAPLRRGIPTVYATAGRLAATTTGDMLFSRAFAELAATGSAGAVRALSDASTSLARGELMQRADAWTAVSVERYLQRCERKTASLFAAACRLGAVLGGAPGRAAPLAAFGRRIGLAFQLLDDVLDVTGPPERTGKHRGTDLLDGTVTLPLILARASDPELRAMNLLEDVTGPAQAEAVCDRIAKTGALGTSRVYALEHVAEAKAALGELDLGDRREALELVADSVVERYA